MAVSVTGTPLNLGAFGNANSGTVSSTITVPADCDAILVVMAGLSSTVNFQSGGSVTFTKGGTDVAMKPQMDQGTERLKQMLAGC